MTLGRVPGRNPGVLGGHVRAPPSPFSRLTRPQHCLSDRPVLGPHGQLHFPHQEPWGRGGPGQRCCSPTPRAVTWAPLGKWLVLETAPGLTPEGEEACPVLGSWLHSGACGTASLPGPSEQRGPCLQPLQTVQNTPAVLQDLRGPPLHLDGPHSPSRELTRFRVGSHCAGTRAV